MYWPTSIIPDGCFGFLQSSLGLRSNSGNQATDKGLIVPYSMKGDVLFVAIDIEAYEHDHSKILELGIAVLDTRDIKDVPPGKGGRNWIKRIQPRHLLDEEYAHLVNERYVQGCPDDFHFGISEYEAKSTIKKTLRTTLQYGQNGPGTEKRKVALVVHDQASEQRLLKHLDKKAFGKARIIYTADTQAFANADGKKRRLEDLLEVLQLENTDTHNAGNDAVYTLQALIRMVHLKTFAPKEMWRRLGRLP